MIQRAGFLLLSAALAASIAACGDNVKSEKCGSGTHDEAGSCVSDGSGSGSGGATCGDGTMLDPTGQLCIPNSDICPDGTVLVDNKCQDPAAANIDLEEGPEDNGPGTQGAGDVTLKPEGMGFVIHGCVVPTGDVADLDDYIINVPGPTLVDVTVDGVGGLAGAFVTFADDPDDLYQRFGVNVTSTLAKRQIYFPAAGIYHFAVTDTRTLLSDFTAGTLDAAGDPNGKSCYYATLTVRTPTTTALTPGTPQTGNITDGNLVFYQGAAGAMKEGLNAIDLDETMQVKAAPAIITQVGSGPGVNTNGDSFGAPVDTLLGGVKLTDTTLVVADFLVNTSTDSDLPFTLTVKTSNAQAMPTTGTVANSMSVGQTATSDHSGDNLYYFDVAAANEIDGMNLLFSKPVQGDIIDAQGNLVTAFTGTGATETFTAYKGLVRFQHPGRYYLAVYLPRNATPPNTAFTLTSTVTALAPTALALGTPLTAQAVNTFDASPFTFANGTSPWDSLNATGTGTGTVAVTVLDPATSYGRLDILNTNVAAAGAGAATPAIEDPDPRAVTMFADQVNPPNCPANAPDCSFGFPAAGAPAGVVVQYAPLANYLVKVNAAAPTAAATFGLDFKAQTFTDLGAISANSTKTGETAAQNSEHRYYLTAAPNSRVKLTVTPAVTNLVTLETLDANEETKDSKTGGPLVANTAVLDERVDANGFLAFDVRGTTALAVTYDLKIEFTPAFYTVHNGGTVFADACAGGTDITFHQDVNGYDPTDEGLSDPVTAPAGWKFYGGTAAPQFVISTNGFISFDTGLDESMSANNSLPDGVGEVNIAPYWYDLDTIDVCTKTVGNKLVVQWTGETYVGFPGFGIPVQFQAILDPASQSIEIVYGPGMEDDGTDAAAGVQTTDGQDATAIGFQTSYAAPNKSYLLTHP